MSGLRIVLQRLVRRFTIRKPCWICDKCGWRERHEAEVWCWKCGKSRGGQMIYTPNTNSDNAGHPNRKEKRRWEMFGFSRCL